MTVDSQRIFLIGDKRLLMGQSYIRRISDMILAAYSQEIPGIGGYKWGLVFLSKKDDTAYMNGMLTKEVCYDIIHVLNERKPNLITAQRFELNGRHYNVITDGAEIAKVLQEF